MLSIGDIVRIDDQAEFRSDVQLSAYDDAKGNIALLRSYLFSSTARKDERSATPSRSPAELLGELIDTYSHEKIPNRLVVIANYGHGKSHLALALANYFGKPTDSPELKIVLDKLSHASSNAIKAGRYKTFKESWGRFLVIRLRGDVRRSLREQFVVGLEQALNEYPETKGCQLPFWFGLAEKFLQEFDGGLRQQADDYLAQFGTQVSLLLQEVREKKESAHQRCIDLFKHLHYGVTPDFGGDIALKDAMQWVVQEFCGSGKRFGGVLILFDEFSLYVLNYAHRSASGELQDLLNGVDDHRGRAVFLAFAQHDPITVAREAYQRGQQGQTQQESLERELTRLERKFALYSVLESVINSYLIQPEDVWQHFTQEMRVRGPLFRATDVTLETFRKRYEDDLLWSTEHVQETMTKGCFPLHPLTTALLCNLQFQEDVAHLGTARTVLGFVRGELEARLTLPAVDEGRSTYINWALPVGLVDYFGETLSPTHYQQYQNARQTAGESLTAEQEAVLKALLLQEVTALPNRGGQQVDMLAELAGLRPADTKKTLKELSEAQVILYINFQRRYAFWSVGNDPQKLDRSLGQHLKGQIADWPLLIQASRDNLHPIRVDLDWGHAQDWEAPSYFLTRSFFTVSHLQKLAPAFAYDPKQGLVEGERGCVLWLLARNEDEIEWFKEEGPQVLDQAFSGDKPLPVVTVIPAQPSPVLLDAWVRKRGLESFTREEQKEAGLELYSARLKQTTDFIVEELQRLRIGAKYERLPQSSYAYLAPQAYRIAIRAITESSLNQALDRSYKLAYQAAPPEFFTQFKLNSTNLKNAVKNLANLLRQNSSIISKQLPQGISRELSQRFLRSKWFLLDTGGHICEPGNARLKRAWDFLNETFVAGKETKVREALIPLLNPPYGYDYHTVTLLFCAWYGYHQHDLQLTANGRRVSSESLDEWLGKDPKDFINRICHDTNAALQRRDRALIDQEASEYIERAGESMSQPEAQIVLDWLTEYSRDKNGNQGLQAQAQQAAGRLKGALQAAREYDRKAKEIADHIQIGRRSLTALIGLQTRISNLPTIDNVHYKEATADSLRKEWLKSVQEAIDWQCVKLEALTSTTQVDLHRQKLRELNDQLQAANLTGSEVERVESALATIDKKAGELRALEQEEGMRNAISAMEGSASLQRLYDFRAQLQQMRGYSPQTMGLRDKKLQRIEGEIAQLEKLGQELPEAISRLKSLQEVRDWHNSCLRLHERYVGTMYYDTLGKAEAQAQTLQNFFQELKAIQELSLKTPQEARQIRERVTNLRQQVAGQLSSEQQGMIDKVELLFKQQVTARIAQADQWLASLEQQWQNGTSPAAIKLKLEQAPPFLRQEAKTKLTQLAGTIQARLDKDTIDKIEMQFRQIGDAGRRQQCLERLSQVNQELSGII